uniref:RNA methyltransferase n=1 Tax=Photinus pyralis TaxID=7054 RepID=A0A1Y1L154_PHOPY
MSQTETIPVADATTKQTTKSQRRESDCGINARKKLRNLKNGRKRAKSFCSGGPCKINYMRPILPTRFLLGGNIRDPLNLNSLQDEEINRAVNAVTPKSSPIPTPPRKKAQVEVIIPPNINDPLNLVCTDNEEYEQQLCSPLKKCRKKRVRKKRTSSGTSEVADADHSGCIEAKTPETNTDSAKIPEDTTVTDGAKPKDLTLELKKDRKRKSDEHHKDVFKKFKYHSGMDKIVSPVVPQPGGWLKRSNSRRDLHHRDIRRIPNKNEKMPEFKEKHKQFQYGNYNRYYGYRNQHSEVDLRLLCFSNHKEMFADKDILDIGCNIGHITLSIARDYGAKSIVGVDIDKKLIEIAHKNIKHYVKRCDTPPRNDDENDRTKNSEFFPISMPILYGPLEIPGFTKESDSRRFPKNVTFKHGNYVLDDDSLLSVEQPQFDIILCLSITKWIHLNWGDAGIKQAFRRMYAQLRPGGKLILEPQNWASYKGKKKLTEKIYKNYNSIQFFPENFTQYLLSNDVGFAKSEILGFPQHHARGFQRPVQVYTKSHVFSSERSENSNYSVNRDTPVYLRPYAEPFDRKESVIISDEISETTSN